MKYEDFKNLLRQFAEEYYNDKELSALNAKHFAKRIRDTSNMLNSDKNAPVSDTTEADSSNADHQIKISELRDKFFKECVNTPSATIYPEEVFEWFKPYLRIPSIDWEELEEAIKQAPDWFKHVQGEYYEDNQSVFDWLKTNLQDYIK